MADLSLLVLPEKGKRRKPYRVVAYQYYSFEILLSDGLKLPNRAKAQTGRWDNLLHGDCNPHVLWPVLFAKHELIL